MKNRRRTVAGSAFLASQLLLQAGTAPRLARTQHGARGSQIPQERPAGPAANSDSMRLDLGCVDVQTGGSVLDETRESSRGPGADRQRTSGLEDGEDAAGPQMLIWPPFKEIDGARVPDLTAQRRCRCAGGFFPPWPFDDPRDSWVRWTLTDSPSMTPTESESVSSGARSGRPRSARCRTIAKAGPPENRAAVADLHSNGRKAVTPRTSPPRGAETLAYTIRRVICSRL